MVEMQFDSAWMQFGRFLLDPVTYTVLVADGRMVKLMALEFRMLYNLMSQAGRECANRDILLLVWGARATKGTATNKVAVYIRRLRHKIEADPAHPTHIITIRRKGYLFQP
jgi:DNA-binding response OmpR family regulator